jgi:hypothetical protein
MPSGVPPRLVEHQALAAVPLRASPVAKAVFPNCATTLTSSEYLLSPPPLSVGTAALGCPAAPEVSGRKRHSCRISGSSATPPPPLFVNYSESAGSRVFVRKILEIKALSPCRMKLVLAPTNFMMLEFAEIRKERCHMVAVENLLAGGGLGGWCSPCGRR